MTDEYSSVSGLWIHSNDGWYLTIFGLVGDLGGDSGFVFFGESSFLSFLFSCKRMMANENYYITSATKTYILGLTQVVIPLFDWTDAVTTTTHFSIYMQKQKSLYRRINLKNLSKDSQILEPSPPQSSTIDLLNPSDHHRMTVSPLEPLHL